MRPANEKIAKDKESVAVLKNTHGVRLAEETEAGWEINFCLNDVEPVQTVRLWVIDAGKK